MLFPVVRVINTDKDSFQEIRREGIKAEMQRKRKKRERKVKGKEEGFQKM